MLLLEQYLLTVGGGDHHVFTKFLHPRSGPDGEHTDRSRSLAVTRFQTFVHVALYILAGTHVHVDVDAI